MNPPILGELDDLETGGWGLPLTLPAFQSCYERWLNDGTERPDTRDADEKGGQFWVNIPFVPVDGPARDKPRPPSDAQVAAIEYLKANHGRIAQVVGAALAEQAPTRFHWEYLKDNLSAEMLARLATPEGAMQFVGLQSIVIGVYDHDGIANVGFSFHSEILEPEHGVSVILHQDRLVSVGIWDDLMDMESPEPDEFADDEEDD